jgi:hypothetical protein
VEKNINVDYIPTSVFFKVLTKVKHNKLGEFSPNLVTLLLTHLQRIFAQFDRPDLPNKNRNSKTRGATNNCNYVFATVYQRHCMHAYTCSLLYDWIYKEGEFLSDKLPVKLT